MALPAYVSNLDIYGTGTAVPVAVLSATGPTVLVWSELDEVAKKHLDLMVVANGGSLPFATGLAIPDAYVLPNGQTFSYVYGYVYVDQAKEAAAKAALQGYYWPPAP